MKTIKLSILAGLFFLSSVYSFAQSYTFKVLASTGTNKKSTSSLVVGSVLGSTDQISVGAGGYLNLMYLVGGGAVQINKEGTYTIADLARQLETSKASSGGKFVNYVIGEVTKTGGDINQNHTSYMRVTGSQERKANFSVGDYEINVLLPSESKIFDSKVYINWFPLEKTSTYVLKFTDLVGGEIASIETDKLSYVLDWDAVKFNPGFEGLIQIIIFSKEDASKKSEPIVISRYESKELKTLQTKFDKFKAENSVSNSSPAIKKLEEALFFEENKAYVDATRCYEEAIALEPEAETYKMAYGEFLNRVIFGNIK